MKLVRLILLSLLIALLATNLSSAFAAVVTPGITPQYKHTSSLTSELSISGGTASVKGNVTPTSDAHRANVKVELQQLVDGSWKTIETWTASSTKGGCTAKGTKALTKGYSYRVYTTGKVYNNAGALMETSYKASSSKSY